MTSYQSILECYVENQREIKIAKEFSCNSQDRISMHHANMIIKDSLKPDHYNIIYSVIKESLSPNSDYHTIYDLLFKYKRKEGYVYVVWSTRNGSFTIIDAKIILDGISESISYEFCENKENNDVFSLRFDDVIDIDGAVALARYVISQTTTRIINDFRWILRIKNSSLIYVMTWTTEPIYFPDFLTTPCLRRIFNEKQLKQIITDQTIIKTLHPRLPKKEDSFTIYRIKKIVFFEEMACIEYFIYLINLYSHCSNGIIYHFKLTKTFYDKNRDKIFHRIVWYIKTDQDPPRALRKANFYNLIRKRQRE